MSSAFMSRGRWGFGDRIVVPLLAATLAAMALAGFGLYWATSRSDAVSVDRQVRTTRHAINASIDTLAHEQETAAVWDDALIQLAKPELDRRWIDQNVGFWFYTMFGHNEVFILDGHDHPVYAAVKVKRADPRHFEQLRGDVQVLIDGVRGRLHRRPYLHDRLPHDKLPLGSTVETSDKATHASRLLLVEGRPAVASAMLMVPYVDQKLRHVGREPVLVSIRFLDDTFLRELSARNLIDAPRFSRVDNRRSGEQALPLRTEDGRFIGYLFWRPELPGTAVLHVLAPATAGAITLMVAIMALLAWWLRRSTGQLEATMVELEASEAQAQHLAFHDVLTGLPNRALFHDRLDQALARARRGERLAVLALDLDRFKHVNDTLGHHAGDALIREFGGRIAGVLRESDTVARLGGDEFAILLSSDGDAAQVEAICERLLETVRRPFEVLGGNAFVGVSIGVVKAPDDGFDRVDLLRRADIALYRAKAEGRNCVRFFCAAMDETVRRRSSIEEDLRVALAAGDQLRVFYQPQVAGTGEPVIGMEALVRWEHPVQGLVSPEQFISVAEETGLIGDLGEWVLREACATSRRYPGLFMAVNLSPVQFRSDGFADRVIAIVRASGADPRRIELEVTESVLLDDDDLVREALKKFRRAGLRIALDDFGTGYSSLSYLRRFEVDKIKIDKSFIQHLGRTTDSTAIVTAVVTLGHAMGLTVTAEGVETLEQQRFLEEAGCCAMQGYLFSRAVPAHELPMLLAERVQARAA